MSNDSENTKKLLDKYIAECPRWIIEKSIYAIQMEVLNTSGLKEKIVFEATQDPDLWWADYHFSWGMAVRNFLRDNVCKDNQLPTGNWDDYYVQMVELACGIR